MRLSRAYAFRGGAVSALLVFVCGAFYEASCVGFVHYAEAGGAWRTAAMSALAGLAEVTGIFGTVKDWHIGPFFVAGLGVGAYLGVKLKGRSHHGTTPPAGGPK